MPVLAVIYFISVFTIAGFQCDPDGRCSLDRTLIMTTKNILISGLGAGSTEEGIRSWLGHFGPVVRVNIIRDGDATDPVALVEMEIGSEAAANLVSRLSEYWHEGKLVNARLLIH
jgi:hypothetical protein